MINAFNRTFPEKTNILKACITISGVGKKTAQQVLDIAGVTKNIQIQKLSTSKLSQIKSIIEQTCDVENELYTVTKQNISALSTISCYRGWRHFMGLPCRGQRTHSNARTVRRLRRK